MANSRSSKAAARAALATYTTAFNGEESPVTYTTDLVTDLLLNLSPHEAESVLRKAAEDYFEDRATTETD